MYFCRECGRALTKAGIDGLGPECIKKLAKGTPVEYKYARNSEVSNLGEDIPDSARHRYHEWKGLEAAEASGEAIAQSNITRDKLLRNDPPAIRINSENIIASTIAVTILKRMPSGPDYFEKTTEDKPVFALCKKGSKDNDIIISISEDERRLESLTRSRPGTYVLKLGETRSESNKKIRQCYFEKYEWIKRHSEDFAKKESLNNAHLITDPALRSSLINREVKSFTDSFENEYGAKLPNSYTYMSGDDADFINRYLTINRRNKKYSVGDTLEKTQLELQNGKTDETIQALEKAVAGNSIAIGTEKGSKGVRFNPIIFYSQELKRIGPEINQNSKDEMEFALSQSGPWKLRAAQWGETVSDKERKEHLKNACESLHDLREILDVDDEVISFNGKLGIAFGARGKGKAMAHYEPKHNVINLTRKNGIGALAHEWGHALEKNLYNKEQAGGYGRSLGTIPQNISASFSSVKKQNDFNKIDSSFLENQEGFTVNIKIFYDRMVKSDRFKAMPPKHKEYLRDPAELFARTFEAMVKRKLEKKGRVNTYLVSCEDADIYPNNEELDSIEPFFDKLIKGLARKDT